MARHERNLLDMYEHLTMGWLLETMKADSSYFNFEHVTNLYFMSIFASGNPTRSAPPLLLLRRQQ